MTMQTLTAATTTAATDQTTTDTTTAPIANPAENTGDQAVAGAPKKGEKPPAPDPLAKAKAGADAARRRAAAHRRQEAEHAQTRNELTTLKTKLAESERATTTLHELAKLAETDPYAAMHRMGITVDGLTKHGTPEGQRAKFESEIQKQLEAERAERVRLQNEIQAERQNKSVEAGRSEVRGLLASERFPTLKSLPERIVMREVSDLRLAAFKESGETYSFDEVLSWLETEFSKPAGQTAAATQKPQNGTAGRAPGDRTAPKSRTLTNAQASSSNSLAPELENLTREQREEMIKKKIRARWDTKRSA